MRARNPAAVVLLLALACAAGCVRKLAIPRPRGGRAAEPPALAASEIAMGVRVELRPAFDHLDAQLPETIDETAEWHMLDSGLVGVKYRVTRTPFAFAMQGDTLRAETTLSISAEACVNTPFFGCRAAGSCGIDEPPRRVIVGLDARLSLTPDWEVASVTRPRAPQYLDRCQLTLFRIDVMDRVGRLLAERLATASARVDRQVRDRGHLRPRVEPAWRSLQRPFRAADGLWLLVDPSAVTAGPLDGAGSVITTNASIASRPHLVAGREPPAAGELALPELRAGAPGREFHATLDVAVPFREAAAGAGRALVGRGVRAAGHDVRVTDVRVYGERGAAIVAVDVAFATGFLRRTEGTVYLTGTPRFDAAGSALVVDDLDYTIETRNVLLLAADFLLQRPVRAEIARRARFPMAARIEQTRARAEAALNRRLGANATMSGTLSSVRPLGVYVTPEGFVLRLGADGTARLDVVAEP